MGRAAARVRREPDPAGRDRFPPPGAEIGIVTETTTYPLDKANEGLADLRACRFHGAAVLVP